MKTKEYPHCTELFRRKESLIKLRHTQVFILQFFLSVFPEMSCLQETFTEQSDGVHKLVWLERFRLLRFYHTCHPKKQSIEMKLAITKYNAG